MRAACCEATVLRHEVIADDIRLLTALWPDREHVPHAGQFFTLRAWGADEAPFLSRPISVHKWDAETQTVEFLYAVVGEGTRKLMTTITSDPSLSANRRTCSTYSLFSAAASSSDTLATYIIGL